MSQLFTIENDKIVITNLALTNVEGTVQHTGDLTVSGTITADTINVKHLVNDTGATVASDVGQWFFDTEDELNGKGLSWTWGDGQVQLMYRHGKKLWTNAALDLSANNSYHIDGVKVLSKTELGSQIRKSNLSEVGTLSQLEVSGTTMLGEFAFFNPNENRIGIGTATPNAAIGIMEHEMEVVLGSYRINSGVVGTYTNHDFSIVTDNTPRISIKNTGEVTFGDASSKNAVVKIYGSLQVDNLVTDNRIERDAPLEFKAARNSNIYGKGLIWTSDAPTKQLIMMGNPDRLFSSESIDLGESQSYFINKKEVVSEYGLGASVTKSYLTTLGALESLTVEGTATFVNGINLSSITANTAGQMSTLSGIGVNSTSVFSIKVQESEALYIDNNEISIGNKLNTRRPVKVYGPVSIGITNPDPSMGLSVNGNITFANKKFITGDQAPTSGTFVKGDICWNQTPTYSSYIGWVCIVDGTPGVWVGFGQLAAQ